MSIENVESGSLLSTEPRSPEFREVSQWLEANCDPPFDLDTDFPPHAKVFANRHALTTYSRMRGVLLYARSDGVPTWKEHTGRTLTFRFISAATRPDASDCTTSPSIVARPTSYALTGNEWERLNTDLRDRDSDVRHVASLPVVRTFLYVDISDFSTYSALEQALIINSLSGLLNDEGVWDPELYRRFKILLSIGDGYIFVFDDATEAVLYGSYLARLIEVSAARDALPVEFHFRMGAHTGATYSFWDTGRDAWNYVGDGINGGSRVLAAVGKDQDDVVFISSELRKAIQATAPTAGGADSVLSCLTNRGRRSDKHGLLWRVYEVNHTELCTRKGHPTSMGV